MNRYNDVVHKIRHNGDGKQRYETMLYPLFEPQATDRYIISRKLQRMDTLAYAHYGDPRLWWVIQRANSLPGGTFQIPAGIRVRIPWPLSVYDVQQKLSDRQN